MRNHMSVDKEKLLKRIEKDREIKDLLYPNYEQVELRGAILIDGHHIFLNIIRSIQRLRDDPGKFIKRIISDDSLLKMTIGLDANSNNFEDYLKLISETPIFNHDPREVAKIYRECSLRIADYANDKFKNEVLGEQREFLNHHNIGIPFELRDSDAIDINTKEIAEEILQKYPPNKFILKKSKEERWVFDAKMPSLDQVYNLIEKNFLYWNGKDKRKSDNLKLWLQTLRKDEWGFYENQLRGSIIVPFSLKNETLKAFQDEELMYGDFNLKTQLRRISGFTGYVESREKGVDTKLVIKGCEIAEDNNVDWVWLVTADGDHSPLIDHLRDKGKEVFLTSLSYPSKALISALSAKSNYLHFNDLFDLSDWITFLEDNMSPGTYSDFNAGFGMDLTIYLKMSQYLTYKKLLETNPNFDSSLPYNL